MSSEKIILEPNEDGVYVPSGPQSSSAKQLFKSMGRVVIGFGLLMGLMLLILMFVKGGVWVGEKTYPLLSGFSKLALFLTFFILTPLTLFKPTRSFAGLGIYFASYVFGLTLWVWSLVLTYNLWGIFAVLIGLFFAGIGIVPVALLATLFSGKLSVFGELLLLMAFVPISRMFGIFMVARAAADRNSR